MLGVRNSTYLLGRRISSYNRVCNGVCPLWLSLGSHSQGEWFLLLPGKEMVDLLSYLFGDPEVQVLPLLFVERHKEPANRIFNKWDLK